MTKPSSQRSNGNANAIFLAPTGEEQNKLVRKATQRTQLETRKNRRLLTNPSIQQQEKTSQQSAKSGKAEGNILVLFPPYLECLNQVKLGGEILRTNL